jgi:hypothetical protein
MHEKWGGRALTSIPYPFRFLTLFDSLPFSIPYPFRFLTLFDSLPFWFLTLLVPYPFGSLPFWFLTLFDSLPFSIPYPFGHARKMGWPRPNIDSLPFQTWRNVG